jgi:uncharacterized membrane protein YfcA
VLFTLPLLPLAILIGIVLGALGSGGAILALPVLVYGVSLSVPQAIAVSQIVVGSAALIGALLQSRRGAVRWREASLFAFSGLPATTLGAYLGSHLEARHLMLTFAVLVFLAGARLWFFDSQTPSPRPRLPLCLALGALVGLLTGMLGVGGGFLLVPAMIAFAGIDTRAATATSLPVIALNSLTGALQHVPLWSSLLPLVLTFLLATLLGTFLGLALARRASERHLRRSLAILLLAVGAAVALKNL